MMNKHSLALTIAVAVLLLGTAVLPLSAQRSADRRPFQVFLNLGYVNLFEYPKWLNVGPELEVRLGRFFSINPDVSLWIGQSFGRKVKIVPGLTGNFRLGRRLTLGGGAVYRVSDWPDSSINPVDHGWLVPKAQIGYAIGPTRLVFSLLFPGGDNDVAAGLTIGMGFGGGPSRD